MNVSSAASGQTVAGKENPGLAAPTEATALGSKETAACQVSLCLTALRRTSAVTNPHRPLRRATGHSRPTNLLKTPTPFLASTTGS